MNSLQLIPYIVVSAGSMLLLLGFIEYTRWVYPDNPFEYIATLVITMTVGLILLYWVTLKTQQLVSDCQLKLTHQVYENYCLV